MSVAPVMRGSGWYPDHQIRLFRKGTVRWSDTHHTPPQVTTGRARLMELRPPGCLHIHHRNYESLRHFAEKQLRYALEVRGRLRRVPTAASLRQLRAVQETLGRAHDLHVLGEHLRQVEARIVTRSRPAARDLRRMASGIDDTCRQHHAAFLGRRAALRTLSSALLAPGAPARPRSAA